MLDAFIAGNRGTIIQLARQRAARRTGSIGPGLPDGIPAFVDQLVVALRQGVRTDEIDLAQISATAMEHGEDLLDRGLEIGELVHDYGDVCQVVTDLAIDQEARIPTEEFQNPHAVHPRRDRCCDHRLLRGDAQQPFLTAP